MVVFGIDAGLTAPGFSVVKTSEQSPFGEVVLSECFKPECLEDSSKTSNDTYRIGQITRRILGIIKEHKPDVIVAELPTGGAKSASAIKGMAFSTAMTSAALTAAQFYGSAAKVQYITPIQNKKGSTGQAVWHSDSDNSKWDVFSAVSEVWPKVNWPCRKRQKFMLDDALCWAMADSLSCIMTYLNQKTPLPGQR